MSRNQLKEVQKIIKQNFEIALYGRKDLNGTQKERNRGTKKKRKYIKKKYVIASESLRIVLYMFCLMQQIIKETT